MKKIYLLIVALLAFSTPSNAYQVEETDTTALTAEDSVLLMSYIAADTSFTYQRGEVELGDGLAVINVPEGFKFLDKAQSRQVLEELWGNPEDPSTMGLLFPEEGSPMLSMTYAIEISYAEEGFIDDEDAEGINYDDLLEEMQESAVEESKQRRELGYQGYELVGWASPPYYDVENKKLHWAKELRFDEEESTTLNYNIRILGRQGYLLLNGIGEMEYLEEMDSNLEPILASVNFNEGSRYQDYDPEYDKVAAYGVGGLIAGKVLSKVGFFAVLAKFWKVIAIGGAAVIAGVKKFFFGKGGDTA
ncbi:DUF2167 domain-containing protein [Roseivirga sp. BDSF3-8]|uniref:DUF2167 domain-containing protein n=1 Tax=Roseivirga sp. BDSF3-8 TaxID=3241598 RepID=UPI003531FEEE